MTQPPIEPEPEHLRPEAEHSPAVPETDGTAVPPAVTSAVPPAASSVRPTRAPAVPQTGAPAVPLFQQPIPRVILGVVLVVAGVVIYYLMTRGR